MTPDNNIVNGLWIGTKLSNIELLTMMTFMEQGHRFRLWAYEPLETILPEGVELMDANQIIPAERIFRYKHANAYGHGKGSVSGFSDIFRYKLLHDQGGWWVDMDVACLKPLDFTEEYVFRNHHSLTMVGNVMKCPKGSKLMWDCYEEALEKVTDENRDWHLPIQILNDQIESHSLSKFIKSGISNFDKWDELKRFVLGMKTPPANYYFIHWMNEEWRSRGLDKNKVKARTLLGKMMIDRRLMPAYYSLWHLVQEELYYSKLATYLPWLKDKTPQSLHR